MQHEGDGSTELGPAGNERDEFTWGLGKVVRSSSASVHTILLLGKVSLGKGKGKALLRQLF